MIANMIANILDDEIIIWHTYYGSRLYRKGRTDLNEKKSYPPNIES